MSASITRKFFPKDLPDLSNKDKVMYHRYYLSIGNTTIIRVQQINDTYEIERKVNENDLIRNGQTMQITKDEFEELKKAAKKYIHRDSYIIQEEPKTVIRVYHGVFDGLVRIEVNFTSEKEASHFVPPVWFGKEITDTPLAQDGRLLQLTQEELHALLME